MSDSEVAQIVDEPIRVADKQSLPAEGEEGKIYRTDDDRRYYRYDRGQYIRLPSTENISWGPVDGLFDLIQKARRGEWRHFRSGPSRKYLTVRICMEDGNCLIRDDHGRLISLEELQYQRGQQ